MQTLIIGHKNPDMDAICSAIGYAEFKTLTGQVSARAGRCGNTNERIDYALRRFGFEPPDFVSDVRPRVGDVMETDVVYARHDEPVFEAFGRLGDQRFRGLPVIDARGGCLGLISAFKISRHVFPALGNVEQSREVHASLEAIRRTLGATLLAGDADQEVRNHVLVVVAMQTDSFQKRLGSLDRDRTVLIVGDRRNIQRMAIEAGVRSLVISGGLGIEADLLELAKQRGTVVMGSSRDTATTVLLARSAVSACDLLSDDFLSLPPDLPLAEVRSQVAMSAQFAFPVLDDDGLLVGILSKSDFLKPVPRQLILVDHNELSQAVSGAGDVPIVEILDHHRIGAAPTQQPILFLNRPVGSTCSIVADCFEREGIPIPPNVAGLLMCGLLSDTLNLTSPTTTDFDRGLMVRLSRIAGVDPTALASEIFSVGSPLLTMTPIQAVTADCKEYEEGGHRFCVSQLEELSFSHFEEKREALLAALETYRASKGYDFAAMLVTDINTQNSLLLVQGSAEFARLIDFPDASEKIWRLDGIVSRKKQLLPYLTGLVARLT
ncbi:MAG: putative manganese-dependent inorganic diphosphatase [Terrimicrobiaceae bacterium]